MKTKLLLVFVFALSLVAAQARPAQAEEYAYSVATTINVAADKTATVSTVVTAVDQGGGTIPSSIILPGYGTSISGLAGSGDDDRDIEFSLENGDIKADLSNLRVGSVGNWGLSYSYSTDIGSELGNTFVIYLSPHNYEDLRINSERVTLLTSTELGEYSLRGSEPASTGTSSGSVSNIWDNPSGRLGNGFGVSYGDSAVINATYSATLKNDSFWWQTKEIVLPPDTNQQQVSIESISPRPTNVRLDTDGNVIVQYRLRPMQSLDITAGLSISLYNYSYNLSSANAIGTTDQVLVDRYTELTDAWPDSEISIEISDAATSDQAIQAILAEVVAGSNRDTSGVEAALNDSNKLVGELRAHSIPARLVLGKVATPEGSFNDHAWVEAYAAGLGWITLDPLAERDGSRFGTADASHVALVLRGFDADGPLTNSDGFALSFTDAAAAESSAVAPEITATKYVLLPGISLRTVQVTMPPGVIVDGAGIDIDGEITPLGSLAPLQNVTLRSLSFIGDAFSSETIRYGDFSSLEIIDNVAQSEITTTVSYLPFGLLLFGGLGIWAGKKFVLPKLSERFGRRKKKKDPIKDEPIEEIEEIDLPSDAELGIETEDDDEYDITQVDESPPEPQPAPAPSEQPKPPAAANQAPETPTTNLSQTPPNQRRSRRTRPPKLIQ